jgi:Arc/MetJ-type ribon-helix-helix transcriptional regulator
LSEKAIIGIDNSHSNIFSLEASSFAEFTQFLFTSGYSVAKIESGLSSLNDLKKYKAILLSTPKNVSLQPNEIDNLKNYVKNGGNLLITSSSGGDHTNKTNLNELTRNFGFEFVPDEINDSVNFLNLQKRPLITKFLPHIITEQIKTIVFSSSSSIRILDFLEDKKNIKIYELLLSGLNSWQRIYDGKDWVEEDSPKVPLLVAVEYYSGRIVGFGNVSIFSSLTREYGFTAFDNDILIANILSWLTTGIETMEKPVTVKFNLDLYYWVENIVNKENWESFSDIINVSLKYFKDNYEQIIEEIKQTQKEKLKRKKAFEKSKKKVEKKISEEKVLERVPITERKKEDLEDIMSELEEITGEHFEVSIDLKKDEREINIAGSSLSYKQEDIEEFEKRFPKKAIWHGQPTKTFKEWLSKRDRN